MMKPTFLALACLGALAATPALCAEETTQKFETGMIPAPHIFLPAGAVKGAVMLISDKGGWGDAEKAEADHLVAEGSVVIGVDFPAYLQAMRDYDLSQNGGCIYLVSDIEALSQEVQRAAGDSPYQLPILAGIGEGGALALTIAAQTPDATIGGTLAVDPRAGLALDKPLCTPAASQKLGDRTVYGLSPGALPDPIVASFTPAADSAGRAHVEDLQKAQDAIEIRDEPGDAQTVLRGTLDKMVAEAGANDNELGLPLSILEARPKFDTMAIIYSGDGGWRDIDKEVGGALQENGIPVVGVDSLRYFWNMQSPEQTASDLSTIMDFYRKRWQVRHVVLIGYSFGADVLPATFLRLSPAEQADISQISLLSLSHEVDYQISVMGWLGQQTEGAGGNPVDSLKAIDPKLVQCVYGKEDVEDAGCLDARAFGDEVVELPGDHHFDENYELLAKTVLDGIRARQAH